MSEHIKCKSSTFQSWTNFIFSFFLRLLCFSDFADIILVQGDIFGPPRISSVLPLRPIFCQKCHQRLLRQSCRHGFQQRLFQKRRPAYLGRARPCHAMQCWPVLCRDLLLHYVLSCPLQNAFASLLLLPVIISVPHPSVSLAWPLLHQIYGEILFQS